MTPVDSDANLLLVMRAAEFAGQAHGTQTRKASLEPYINHPLRVANLAVQAGLPAEAVAAALLHDVVEDTPVTQAALAAAFPARVIALVALLTQSWPDDASNDVKQREKPLYYGAIARDEQATVVKLLDRADNLHDMVRMLPRNRDWASRYLRKTHTDVAPLAGSCANAFARGVFEEAVARLTRALEPPRR